MKIDLHLHCSERSSCSIATTEEQINQAKKMGLDAIVITEHDLLLETEYLEKLNRIHAPFKIYGGIEIRLFENGYEEDLIIIGVHDKLLENKKWTYPELYDFVTKKNGFIGLAHPYRYKDFIAIDVENYPPHAIELYSSNLDEEKLDMRIQLAENLNCHLMVNSDSHSIHSTGKYFNIMNRTPRDEKDLVNMLINGEYTLSKNTRDL